MQPALSTPLLYNGPVLRNDTRRKLYMKSLLVLDEAGNVCQCKRYSTVIIRASHNIFAELISLRTYRVIARAATASAFCDLNMYLSNPLRLRFLPANVDRSGLFSRICA